MRIPRLTHCLLTLVCTLVGCTQTGGFRSNATANANPNIRTVASVGDKPIPIVNGEPGLSERPETAEIDLPPASGARISGRVFDDRGRPVPNATVRLAAGGSPTGKASYATTDRSGAFTLRGLRAGTHYTVIAEYDDQRGAMSGRMEAKAPDTGVRISLRSRDGKPDEAHSTIRPAKSRVEASEDEEETDSRATPSRAGRYNSEDLEPPAAEATSMSPRSSRNAARLDSGDELPPVRAGWNPQRRPVGDGASSGSPNSGTAKALRSPRSSVEPSEDDEDEGPNPLPPALSPRKVGSTFPGDSGDDPTLKIVQDRPKIAARSGRATGSVALAAADPNPSSSGRRSSNRQPRSVAEDIAPDANEMRPDSFAPIRPTEPSDSADRESRSSQRPRRRSNAAKDQPRSSRSESSDDAESNSRRDDDSTSRATGSAGAAIANANAFSRRPTWRDVAVNQEDVPVDESVRLASHVTDSKDEAAAVKEAPKAVTATATPTAPPTTSRSRRGLFHRLAGSKDVPAAAEPSQGVCRIDPTDRRLLDLRLPDLDGKIVSFHDIDADLVLLDFWGSWCKECRKSIPHLEELQGKYGENRLRVIGIACERGARAEDRQASAVKAAQSFKINYKVLVSSMDGTCPVQQGMQIHFYPTMILLDHTGRIIRREQGATDATLARIDRAIAQALK
jgi:thiol-disulfide isomerase/thioredoxin